MKLRTALTKLVSRLDRYVRRMPDVRHDENLESFVYLGASGIAVAYLHLYLARESLALGQQAGEQYLERAWRCVRRDLAVGERWAEEAAWQLGMGSSLMCGLCGALAVACVVAYYRSTTTTTTTTTTKAGDWAELCAVYGRRYSEWEAVAVLPHTPDEVLYGRSGYLLGALWINAHLPAEHAGRIEAAVLERVADTVLRSGQATARLLDEGLRRPELMYYWQQEDYVGAAHGLLGVYHVLTLVHRQRRAAAPDCLRRSVDWLAAAHGQRLPFTLSGAGAAECRTHWCHGGGGGVYTLLAEARWLPTACALGEQLWRDGLLKKGPGLCHGAAGNGYALLALHRSTADPLWLRRARAFGAWLAVACDHRPFVKRPSQPYSLWEGIAGTVCYLLALLVTPADAAHALVERLPFYDLPVVD